MNDVAWFDLIVIALAFILGFKGYIRGFVREFFGLLGIVGGIMVASRYAQEAGKLFDGYVYKIDNDTMLFFIGFLLVLLVIWIGCLIIGELISKLIGLSGLGFFDGIAGFIVGSIKIFIILAVIIVIFSRIDYINEKINPYVKNSFFYPILVRIGDFVIKINPEKIKEQLDNNLEKTLNIKQIQDKE